MSEAAQSTPGTKIGLNETSYLPQLSYITILCHRVFVFCCVHRHNTARLLRKERVEKMEESAKRADISTFGCLLFKMLLVNQE